MTKADYWVPVVSHPRRGVVYALGLTGGHEELSYGGLMILDEVRLASDHPLPYSRFTAGIPQTKPLAEWYCVERFARVGGWLHSRPYPVAVPVGHRSEYAMLSRLAKAKRPAGVYDFVTLEEFEGILIGWTLAE